MNGLLIALACLAGADTAASTASAGGELVGTWRLVSNDDHRPDGTVTAVWGDAPSGTLIYAANGRMAVQLMDPRRRKFASEDRMAGTAEEVRQAFEGYLAYFGTWRVDASTRVVVHNVEGASFPNLIGTEQPRTFVLSGDRLTLSTPPMVRAGRRSTYVLLWERVR
jgi:hypothetical protein